ncbi:MAG: peptide ABC transporter ATP-binding protein, partial [Spirochaetaceae bacterium]
MKFLEATDLSLEYQTTQGPLRAVDGVSFVIDEPGQTLGIIGESGSGKTSM